MTISALGLFTPTPSGVSTTPGATPPSGSWLAQLLANGATLGLPTTAWPSGGITRTTLAMLAEALAGSDNIVSTMAQGGFLDWAAAVTQDPLTLGINAQPGWLDKLAQSGFNCPRNPAQFAGGTMSFVNTGSAQGPYAPGTFHVENPGTGKTYSNTGLLTIAANGTTTAAFQADLAGKASTSGPGTITSLVTTLVGITCTNVASFVGSDPEGNQALVARCRLKQGSLSPNGPKAAYQYFALQALATLQTQNSSVTFRNGPITRVLTQANTATGSVNAYIANAVGAQDGAVSVQVTAATNASPIVITVSSATGIATNDWVLVQGVQGNTAANGFAQVIVSGFNLTLVGTTGNGNYTGGGTVEAGDLGLTDYVLQSSCVPITDTATTQWASSVTVNVAVTAYVPAAQGPAATTAIQNAITSYMANVPIGGFLTGVPTPNTIPIAGAEASCAIAAPYIQDIAVTFNGSANDLPMGSIQVPILGTLNINIITF